ncbi:hypothetical protein GMMP13_1890010 [Candidatus Magnetomoraceae bacterium gMMP-13]
MDTKFSQMETKMQSNQNTLIKWLIGLFISQIGITITLIKLL